MKKFRILALMHDYMVPLADVSNVDLLTVEWKTEYDVTSSLIDMGHDVMILGVKDDLGVIRQAIDDFKPQIAFNLMEAFHEIGAFDMNVVSYLELLRLPYTGCNPQGMVLSRDKALSKQLMSYHRDSRPGVRGLSARTGHQAAAEVGVPPDRQVAHAGGLNRHRRKRRSSTTRPNSRNA